MSQKTRIRIAVKIRPNCQNSPIKISKELIEQRQQQKHKSSLAQYFTSKQTIQGVDLTYISKHTYSIDKLYDANNPIFSLAKSIDLQSYLDYFLQGYNTTIIAYGQTGSGKTHALQHESKEHQSKQSTTLLSKPLQQQQIGIIPFAIQYIAAALPSSALLKCSYIHLYNEGIYDMLTNQEVRLRYEFGMENVKEVHCSTYAQMYNVWSEGRQNRIVADNLIHKGSSRSHAFLIFNLEDTDEEGNARIRQLMFVDLAGSEKANFSEERISNQSIYINKSLFFLRKVVLAYNRQSHVPYRDSKLTTLLRKAFGGNCLTLMLACVNGKDIEETMSTLQYAVQAGKIQNVIQINVDQKVKLIRELTIKNKNLQKMMENRNQQNEELKKCNEQLKQKDNQKYANRVVECIATIRDLLKSNKDMREELDREKLSHEETKQKLKKLQKQFMDNKHRKLQPPILTQKVIRHNKSVSVEVFQQRKKQNKSVFRRSKYHLRYKLKTQGNIP